MILSFNKDSSLKDVTFVFNICKLLLVDVGAAPPISASFIIFSCLLVVNLFNGNFDLKMLSLYPTWKIVIRQIANNTLSCRYSCDSTLVASPSSVDLPQFDVDADVLARSPVGSVADLSTCVQSDVEECVDKGSVDNNSDAKSLESESVEQQTVDSPANGQSEISEVDIVVTSPRGTESVVTANEPDKVDGEEKEQETGNVETEETTESSEFVNSQGVTFKPTAETVDDAG